MVTAQKLHAAPPEILPRFPILCSERLKPALRSHVHQPNCLSIGLRV
jgi:hypothetical protein